MPPQRVYLLHLVRTFGDFDDIPGGILTAGDATPDPGSTGGDIGTTQTAFGGWLNRGGEGVKHGSLKDTPNS